MPMNVSTGKQILDPQLRRIADTLIAFWLIGWCIKADFFVPYIFDEIVRYPIMIDFFPLFLRDPLIAQFFYVLPLFAFIVILKPTPFYYGFASTAMVVSSAVLLLHQDTHNDATFVTSFWTALWLCWYIFAMKRNIPDLLVHARALALCVIAFVFWGGFIGKLTPEFWNGIVLGDIFMRQNFGWIGEWVRAHYTEEVIRMSFVWISKFVVLSEGVLAFAPLWPFGFVFAFGIVFMCGLSLFTTWRIFSVILCLIGLLCACRQMAVKK